MNKIYKVVWSKVKNCYVVVSEIAKNVITGSVKSAKVGAAPMVKCMAMGVLMAFMVTAAPQPAVAGIVEDATSKVSAFVTVSHREGSVWDGTLTNIIDGAVVTAPYLHVATDLTVGTLGQNDAIVETFRVDNITGNVTTAGAITASDFIVGTTKFSDVVDKVGKNETAIGNINTVLEGKASATDVTALANKVTYISTAGEGGVTIVNSQLAVAGPLSAVDGKFSVSTADAEGTKALVSVDGNVVADDYFVRLGDATVSLFDLAKASQSVAGTALTTAMRVESELDTVSLRTQKDKQELQGNINKLANGAVATNTENISALQTAVTGHTESISAINKKEQALEDAIKANEQALKDALITNETAVKEAVKDLQEIIENDVVVEAERATAEEERIEGKVDAEADRATAEEERIEGKVDAEADRAQEAEIRLQENIDEVADRAQEAEIRLQENIDAEVAAREKNFRSLEDSLNAEVQSRKEHYDKLDASIAANADDIATNAANIGLKADKTYVDATFATQTALAEGLAGKANVTDVYTKTVANETFATKSALSEGLSGKANVTDVYTKTELDNMFAATGTATGFDILASKTQNIDKDRTVSGTTYFTGNVEVEGNVQAATFNGIDLNKALSVLGVGANTTYWTAEDSAKASDNSFNTKGQQVIPNSTNKGELRISGCEFKNNIKDYDKAGEAVKGVILGESSGYSKVIIENGSRFEGNVNKGEGRKQAVVTIYSDAQISDSYFMDNITTDMGGALYLSTKTFDITDSVFSGNKAGQGAAIQGNAATINLSGNTFTGNVAKKEGGDSAGAINIEKGQVNFKDANTFNENKSLNGNGGALYNKDEVEGKGNAEFNFKEGSITYFKNNYAKQNGGAIYNTKPINVDGTVIFEGNKAGVEFDVNGNVIDNTGRKNDIYNDDEININQSGVVILDGGIEGTGKIKINGGTLNGKVTGNSVVMADGIWDLASQSEVKDLSGKGTLKVDLTKEELEQVKVQSDAADLSGISVDHGGVLGVNVEEGVAKYYQSVIGSDNQSLIKNREIGDIFLQASVSNVTFDEEGKVDGFTTTINPGSDFVINSESVIVSGNLSAGSITVDGVDLNDTVTNLSTEIAGVKDYANETFATKAALADEA
ncbi:MAG: hypothetical protein IKW41_05095, partial [Phascolarctobacterium sp.]|nr:hypothetical protein [Phascolarctobacterium sp.]